MRTLPLPLTSKYRHAPSLQFRPLLHPPNNMFRCNGFISTSPSHPPLLNTYPLSAFTLPSTPPPPTSSQPINNSPPHPQRTPRPPQNLRILQWNAGVLSPSRHAQLIAFLSNNQYDLILLQETHLSATKKFQTPRYFNLRTDRTFARQGLFASEVISPVVVSSLLSTLTWPSLLFLSPLFLPRTPTQTASVLKFFFPTTLSYNSLTSTSLLSEALLLILAPGPSLPTSFQTPLTLLSLETWRLQCSPPNLG